MAKGAHFDDPPPDTGGQPAAGDAGGSFLDMVNGAAQADPAKAKAFRTESEHIKTMAENGDFAVNEAAGNHAKRAAQIFLDGYAEHIGRLRSLRAGPALGNSPYAQVVRKHVAQMVDSDEQSLLPVLEDIKAGFEIRIAAIDTAMRNYYDDEWNRKENLRKLKENE